MNISISKRESESLRPFYKRFDLLEILFYLVVLSFFIGKVYNVFIALLDLLFFYRVVRGRIDLRPYRDICIAIALFGGYLFVQAFFTRFPLEVLRTSMVEVLYLLMIPAALVTFQEQERLKRLIIVAWIAAGAVIADALYQYVTGRDIFGYPKTPGSHRLTAWREGKSLLGIMIPIFSGIFLAAPLLLKELQYRVVGVVMIALLLVTIILAGNRSPLLALFSAFIFLAIISRYRKVIFATLVTFVALFVLVLQFNKELAPKYEALLHPTTNHATSNRYHIFLTGWEMIKDNPLLGIGPGAYDRLHLEYTKKIDWERYKEYLVKDYLKRAPAHVHSVLIDMVLSYGLIGFGLLLYLYYLFFKRFILKNELTKIAALGFFYSISPLAFSRAFTVDGWQFQTYLALVFVVAVAKGSEKKTA